MFFSILFFLGCGLIFYAVYIINKAQKESDTESAKPLRNKGIIILIIFSLFLLSFCQTNRIKLLNNDYQVINYSENILEIKVINSEKITQINNATYPYIYIEFNKKTYFAKGNVYYRALPSYFCDYFFPIDGNGKIHDFQNNSIKFIETEKIK